MEFERRLILIAASNVWSSNEFRQQKRPAHMDRQGQPSFEDGGCPRGFVVSASRRLLLLPSYSKLSAHSNTESDACCSHSLRPFIMAGRSSMARP